jgi:hypothetical protein
VAGAAFYSIHRGGIERIHRGKMQRGGGRFDILQLQGGGVT